MLKDYVNSCEAFPVQQPGGLFALPPPQSSPSLKMSPPDIFFTGSLGGFFFGASLVLGFDWI